ncbi:hypothetical protein DL89DRAFT_254513 [Linderina pennispora]|uniref:Uncharacterized protein n=1 Tax=Linderina pennispora TaxID=61395 RepID=A0A1Y1WNM6_9FUNG|nr:uncharacterized protein DL89DRAFT_254513 [Linderina pennispora]ORX74724.1 hypothetical protein DL89DRAFT_254513 [Linderina pennispora]
MFVVLSVEALVTTDATPKAGYIPPVQACRFPQQWHNCRGSKDFLRFLDMHLTNNAIDGFSRFDFLDEGRFKTLYYLKTRNLFTMADKITKDRISHILRAFHWTPVTELRNGFDLDYAMLQQHHTCLEHPLD